MLGTAAFKFDLRQRSAGVSLNAARTLEARTNTRIIAPEAAVSRSRPEKECHPFETSC